MFIGTFILKLINNKRKILTHQEIISRIAEKIELLITQVCKEPKLLIHPSLRRPSFSFTYVSSLTFKLYVYIGLTKGILLKKIRNHSKPLKFVTHLQNRQALRKLNMQLRIPSCLGYGPKSFNI